VDREHDDVGRVREQPGARDVQRAAGDWDLEALIERVAGLLVRSDRRPLPVIRAQIHLNVSILDTTKVLPQTGASRIGRQPCLFCPWDQGMGLRKMRAHRYGAAEIADRRLSSGPS
jgi:hypothetical protein